MYFISFREGLINGGRDTHKNRTWVLHLSWSHCYYLFFVFFFKTLWVYISPTAEMEHDINGEDLDSFLLIFESPIFRYLWRSIITFFYIVFFRFFLTYP